MSSAAGINTERGDTISVEPLPFSTEAADRRAAAEQAEKDRQALPVVETEWLFALLDMADLPTDKDERKAFLANMETPLFFYYAGKDRYYIRCQRPCNAEGLHETTAPDFNHYNRYALKGEV